LVVVLQKTAFIAHKKPEELGDRPKIFNIAVTKGTQAKP
jgi:hypothetical protein